MKAHDIASKAAELVSGDREKTHGRKAVNFLNIARLWNSWLMNKGANIALSPSDVAELMALLKIARMASGQFNPDDHIDAVGYVAIAGELAAPVETMR